MKKAQRTIRDFEKLKLQLQNTENIVRNTKDSALWNHEASIRKKIKILKELQYKQMKEYNDVYNGYLELLDVVSVRLLNFYNKKNGTDYKFEDIISKDKQGYINSGLMSVLITSHIPRLIANEFTKYFPANPKDEYEKARAKKRNFILHLGETNTGKTYQAVERLKQANKGVYLAPLRILALENYEKLNKEGVPCNLITGEEEMLVESAKHVCSTIEKLDVIDIYDVAVIDEIQMIANSQRGQAWTKALLALRCAEIHICGALNAKELVISILNDCGDTYEVFEYKRQTPLEVMEQPYSFNKVAKGDALVAFSKKRVLELSKYFLEKGIKNSVIYGDLPPEVRRIQYQLFLKGTNSVLITTDAIGMGVNLPIRRIIFMSLQKFDGEDMRYLTSQEVKQISGRAGRKGIYDIGYVGVVEDDSLFLRDNLETEDEPLTQAVLGPSEIILNIKGLPLKEKLALWSTRQEKLDYYKKMDVRDFLLILESIKQYKLPEATEYKLMMLPFDVNDTEVLSCFIAYVEEYFRFSKGKISLPEPNGSFLSDWERYYQKLNLYYSFSKSFNIDFDPNWVYSERERISKRINSLLLRL
ncbi:MAG: RNA helicase [Clostridiales bacterium GWF2_36_10]|nr:MAG: RNA helicase [Clostridiales bacterium GWF2_36_10]HAN20097.1 RNA helicase [Clostridiales bacterium]